MDANRTTVKLKFIINGTDAGASYIRSCCGANPNSATRRGVPESPPSATSLSKLLSQYIKFKTKFAMTTKSKPVYYIPKDAAKLFTLYSTRAWIQVPITLCWRKTNYRTFCVLTSVERKWNLNKFLTTSTAAGRCDGGVTMTLWKCGNRLRFNQVKWRTTILSATLTLEHFLEHSQVLHNMFFFRRTRFFSEFFKF